MHEYSVTVEGDEKLISSCLKQLMASTMRGAWQESSIGAALLFRFEDLRDVVSAEHVFRSVGLRFSRGTRSAEGPAAGSDNSPVRLESERPYLHLVTRTREPGA